VKHKRGSSHVTCVPLRKVKHKRDLLMSLVFHLEKWDTNEDLDRPPCLIFKNLRHKRWSFQVSRVSLRKVKQKRGSSQTSMYHIQKSETQARIFSFLYVSYWKIWDTSEISTFFYASYSKIWDTSQDLYIPLRRIFKKIRHKRWSFDVSMSHT